MKKSMIIDVLNGNCEYVLEKIMTKDEQKRCDKICELFDKLVLELNEGT